MAVFYMKRSDASGFGLDPDDEGYLQAHPEVSAAFARFCAGPTRPDLLLPPEERPMSDSRFGLDAAEEENIWAEFINNLAK